MIRVLLVFCLAFGVQSVQAGAWTQSRGGHYLKLSYGFVTADRILAGDGGLRYDNDAIYTYGEVGLTDRWTLVLSAPLVQRSVNEVESVRGTTEGVFAGDVEARVRFGLWQHRWVVSAEAGLKLPAVYDTAHSPPLGNGETDVDIGLLVGRSLPPLSGYVTGEARHRWRGGAYVDELQLRLETGLGLGRRWLLRVMGDGIHALQSGPGASDLFGFPLDQRRWRVGGGILLRVRDGVEIDVTFLQTVAGQNVLRTTEVFVGLAHKSI